MTSHPKLPNIVERLSDMDLEALAFTYEQNPSMIFSAQVVECLRELQRLRSPVPAEAIEALPPPDYVLGWRRGLEEAAKECIRLATDCAMHGDPNDCDVCKLAADRIRSLSPPAGDAG